MLEKIYSLKTRSSEEGFTLIELMVVVIIIGILAAIDIPIFANQQKAAQTAAVKTDIKNIALAMENFYTKNRTYPMSSAELASSPIVVSDKNYYSTNTNLLLCISNSNNFGYAIYAKANSGEILSYSSYSGKLKTETITFPESMTIICPAIGITPGQPNQIGIWGYTNAAWEPWVK